MLRTGKTIPAIFVLLALIALFLLLVNYLGKPKIKDYTPDYNAALLDGTPVSPENFKGKKLVVYFWSTWCPTCKYQSPMIEKLAKEMPVLGVCTYSGTDRQVREFMDKNNYTFPTVNDYGNEVRRAFSVKALPTTFILDENGTIIFSEVGLMTGLGLRLRLKMAK